MQNTAHLPGRSVLQVTGADRVSFLNGLVSNDVTAAAPNRAVWAALLTPQGKWLSDFFITASADTLFLDIEAAHAEIVTQRLTRFRLRADVHITPSAQSVFAAWGGASEGLTPDPRLPEAGHRILAETHTTNAPFGAWDAHRIALGLPDGSRDLEQEKTILLEAGFDELNGISWTKGCYMGQELTARTRYRGLIKKRLLPLHATAPLGPPGTPVTQDGREVGTLRSVLGNQALALLRLDALEKTLDADGVALEVRVPEWARLAAAA
jgi:folate-binding protein YgfZ